MIWILSSDEEIAVNRNQIQARKSYIQNVSNADVSPWRTMELNGKVFYVCTSYDDLNGIFITAHVQDVMSVCSIPYFCTCELIVANTCIWHMGAEKEILKRMTYFNKNIELWFAEQKLFIDRNQTLRLSTELKNIGLFGFQTSLSERKLFRHRSKGLLKAIQNSFVKVSPIF